MPLQLSDMQTGGRYNWIGQNERLVYLGRNFSGNGYWNQFALVENIGQVWCEVLDRDLCSLEPTCDAAMTSLSSPAAWVGLSPERIAFYQSTHCIFPGTLAKIGREIQSLNSVNHLEQSLPDTPSLQIHDPVDSERGLLAIGWQRADGSLHKGCPPLGELAGWQVVYTQNVEKNPGQPIEKPAEVPLTIGQPESPLNVVRGFDALVKQALEILAVATLHSPDLQKKRTQLINEMLQHLQTPVDGQSVYDLSAVIGLTHRKARTIMERDGHKITGFVLTQENGEKCIVDMSAVRWFRQGEDFLRMMHPPIEPIINPQEKNQ